MATRLTKKAFREFLNRESAGEPKHRHFRYQQRKRPYGDYLYAQDREKFNFDYAEWLKEKEQEAVKRLSDAIAFVQKNYPLPRCTHGNALKDHAGDLLEPSCGCRF